MNSPLVTTIRNVDVTRHPAWLLRNNRGIWTCSCTNVGSFLITKANKASSHITIRLPWLQSNWDTASTEYEMYLDVVHTNCFLRVGFSSYPVWLHCIALDGHSIFWDYVDFENINDRNDLEVIWRKFTGKLLRGFPCWFQSVQLLKVWVWMSLHCMMKT